MSENSHKLPEGYKIVPLSYDFANRFWDRIQDKAYLIFDSDKYTDYIDNMMRSLVVARDDENIVFLIRPLSPPYALVHGVFFTKDALGKEEIRNMQRLMYWLMETYALTCVECKVNRESEVLDRLLKCVGYSKIEDRSQVWGENTLSCYRFMGV